MKNGAYITAEYVRGIIGKRDRDIHKGNCGKILIIAGAKGMAGAAALCGRGAYRAGAGVVKICLPEELFPIIQIALPEAICLPRGLEEIDLESFGAVAIGPGLGGSAENEGIVLRVLEGCKKTAVLDADALNILANNGKISAIRNAPGQVIITPHMGEAARLIQRGGASDQISHARGKLAEGDRRRLAEALREETGAIVVLKGPGTIVAGGKSAYTNTTGNPGMATAGSGDVLTGIIAAFAAQGKEALDAARAGVYIHGRAGDLAAASYGEWGMLAMDIAEMTAIALKEIEETKQ